ncbi:MAG: beta-lactamase family protein [Chitinophagales bacterium]|nr:beta-lactamase family protein [Chitinophagales bacterium]
MYKFTFVIILAISVLQTPFAQKLPDPTKFTLLPDSTLIRIAAGGQRFSGSLLVQKGDQVIANQAFGLSDREQKTSNRPDTRYKIASITKAFTAVLILQLYEQGKLDLGQSIGAYWPEYKGPGRDSVTLHQLLTHSSGIQNCEAQGLDIYAQPHSSADILDKYCSGPLVNKPGSQFSYNNGDYMILGKIIENIYKKPFAEVLQSRILKPAGMTNTEWYKTGKARTAKTYLYNDSLQTWQPDAPFYIENYGAAGALCSTTADLLKFSKALFGGTLLEAETLALMTTPYPQFWNTAYGVWVSEKEYAGQTLKVVERYGSIQGANTLLAYFPEKQLTLVLLANSDACNLGLLADEIVRILIP